MTKRAEERGERVGRGLCAWCWSWAALCRDGHYRCLWKNTPSRRASALRHSSRNSSPAPDVVLFQYNCHKGLLIQRSVFSQTPVLLTLSMIKIHQMGVQWKQGVVIRMMLYTSSLYDTTPIHCIPPPTAPPCNEYPLSMIRHVETVRLRGLNKEITRTTRNTN